MAGDLELSTDCKVFLVFAKVLIFAVKPDVIDTPIIGLADCLHSLFPHDTLFNDFSSRYLLALS